MKKKILIFSLSYYPKHIGGAEVALKEITDRISDDRYEFHMVCNRYDSSLARIERVGNVLVHRIGFSVSSPNMGDLGKFPLHLNKVLFQFLAYFKAKQLHRKYQYDGVWAMMAHACAVPAGLFKGKYPGVSYMLTLQEGDPPLYIEKKMRAFGRLFRNGFLRADCIQSISTFLAAWGERMGGGKGVVIPNAVDTKHFSKQYSAAELNAARAALGKKEGDVFLVTTSRLVHKNGIDTVVRALPLLPAHIHFVVYGTGPDEAMLRLLSAELGVEDRVHFRGHIDHQDMPKCLASCDIFVRPSRSEGMGNSFLEAMAVGLPVIATQEGGIADFLYDAVRNPDKKTTGWAVAVDSPEDIKDAVQKIIGAPLEAAGVTHRAQEMVVQHYDWSRIAGDMREKIFDALLQ